MSSLRSVSLRLLALCVAAVCAAVLAPAAQAAAPSLSVRVDPQATGVAVHGFLFGDRTDAPAANTWRITVEQAAGTGWTPLTTVSAARYGYSGREFTAPLPTVATTDCGDLRVTVKSGTVVVKQQTIKPCLVAPSTAPIKSLAAGDRHTCALHTDGTVACWGDDNAEQLGSPYLLEETSPTPVRVEGLTDATAIAAGGRRTCALRADKTVVCWGYTEYDGMYDEGSSTPFAIKGVADAVSIAVGGEHACAVRTDGHVLCWGTNTNGQLGNGTTTSTSFDGPAVEASGMVTATAVAAGATHTCVITVRFGTACWGSNGHGQLGNGTKNGSTVPMQAQRFNNITAISLGTGHSCALDAFHHANCWGWNSRGQLGDGTTKDRAPSVWAGLLNDVKAVSVHDVHSCAIRMDTSVVCWGGNSSGEVGDGTTTNALSPTTVPGVTGAIAIASGRQHTCAALSSGGIRCWGRGAEGQLGNGTANTTGSYTPVLDSSAPADATSLVSGTSSTCAFRQTGDVSCWGQTAFNSVESGSTPRTLPGATGATAVSLTGSARCAVRADRTVQCWGNNSDGELGNGTVDTNYQTFPPSSVTGLTNAKDVSSGQDHVCAVRTTGTVACWGASDHAQLGSPASTTPKPLPYDVPGLTDATAVAAGYWFSCALRIGGTVVCWGDNQFGELGRSTPADNDPYPAPVTGLANVKKIVAGRFTVCALRTDGKVFCWGRAEDYGALGNGVIAMPDGNPIYVSATPVQAVGLTDAVDISGDINRTCALRADKTVSCWGAGFSNHGLGNGNYGDVLVPTPVLGLKNVVSVAVAADHVCALDTASRTWCWGDNYNGQLGPAYTALAPVSVLGLA